MKSKLAVLLTAVIGFSIATVVFAQEAMKADSTVPTDTMQNSAMNEEMNEEMNEVANETMNEEMNEAVNDMPAADAAPAEAPAPETNKEVAPAAY